jgi:hypothetical protein
MTISNEHKIRASYHQCGVWDILTRHIRSGPIRRDVVGCTIATAPTALIARDTPIEGGMSIENEFAYRIWVAFDSNSANCIPDPVPLLANGDEQGKGMGKSSPVRAPEAPWD